MRHLLGAGPILKALRPAVIAGAVFCLPIAAGQNSPVQIEVAGLLGDKAVLIINGRQKMLQAGAEAVNGIRLIAVEAEGALLEINGTQEYYALGGKQITTQYAVKEKISERVYRDNSGMFRTIGSINGYPVSFLVDTGASIIAMNVAAAKRIGIQYLLEGQSTMVSTASGNAAAYSVRLDSVAVGQIKLSNIEAVVIDGTHPPEILLGMSFLSRLNVRNENEVMLLEPRF
ncbi:MAG TPA: retropepsin-like aspartic protease [Gammaproteobacteria bacterium]